LGWAPPRPRERSGEKVADQLRPKLPKLAGLPRRCRDRRAGLHDFRRSIEPSCALPIERLNGEIKRRTDVVGIFPNEDAIVRLIGAILLAQNDKWAVQRTRYMTLETIAH
jgi:putative transposase